MAFLGSLGGIKVLRGEELKKVEAELQTSLNKFATGEGPVYRVSKVHSATRQVVSGTLTHMNVDLIDDKNVSKNCDISIWSRAWLPQGIEVTFMFPGETKFVRKHDA